MGAPATLEGCSGKPWLGYGPGHAFPSFPARNPAHEPATRKAARWDGKLDLWDLAASLGLPPSEVRGPAERGPYATRDCTLASLGLDGGTPPNCPWVDRVRVAFAEALGQQCPDMYVPT